MIAYRIWRVVPSESGPVLRSMAWPVLWSNLMTADRPPRTYDEHGIYAVLPEAVKGIWSPGTAVWAVGAVDVFGTIQVHSDGTVRAEHAKILALHIPFCGDDIPGHEDTVRVDPTGFTYTYVCPRWWPPRDPGMVSVKELEEALLQRYSVPRLPDSVEV